MDNTTFMIFDILTCHLGHEISIHGLTEKIREKYQKGFYKNIYDKIKKLSKQGIIRLDSIGNSSIIRFEFQNPKLISTLARCELTKKERLSELIISDLNHIFHQNTSIESASIIDSEKNQRLNRIELLVIAKDTNGIEERLSQVAKKYNIKIDTLTLDPKDFSEQVKSPEHNQIKEMIMDKTVIFNQESYWMRIKEINQDGFKIISEKPIHPSKIKDEDIAYNMLRFGYQEIGNESNAGNRYSIETIIIAILLKNDARKTEAIPIIMKKNGNVNYKILSFLAKKYKKESTLLGLLNALKVFSDKKELTDAIMTMNGIIETKADTNSINKKMKLYNGDKSG